MSGTWTGFDKKRDNLASWKWGKIQIWRDNWIRRNGSLKITGKKKNTRIKRVKELFGNGTNGWNEDLVNSLFYPHDAEEVLKIRVGPNQVQDSVAWNAEKNGLFSVKSAYKLAINIKKETPLASSSAPDGKRNIWQRIWKAQVPNKVRIFSRRLALDNLPTQKNKWRRKLEVLNTCLICGNGTEDSFHAVVECTKARALRQRMRDFWILPKEESLRKTGKDWLLVLLDNTNKDMHQAILLTFWRAWHLRNDIIHAKGQATIEHSARFLLSYANTIKSISIIPVGQVMAEEKGKKVADNMLLCEKHQTTSTPEGNMQWEPPPEGWLKVNVDGSFNHKDESGTTGVVIRDHQGQVIVAAGTVIPRCTSAEEAEAAAITEGARLASNWAEFPILFETDCATITKEAQLGMESRSHLRSYFYEFSLLCSSFQDWNCIFAKRDKNKVAHACAAYVRHVGTGMVWHSAFPDSISRILELDCKFTSGYI
jgi:ribonuclease HI